MIRAGLYVWIICMNFFIPQWQSNIFLQAGGSPQPVLVITALEYNGVTNGVIFFRNE